MTNVKLQDLTPFLHFESWVRCLVVYLFVLFGSFFSLTNALADQYEVAMSQNEAVCKASSHFFTDYIRLLHKRFPEVGSIAWRSDIADVLIRDGHAEFSVIDWTEVQQLVPALKDMKGGRSRRRV